MAAHRQLWGWQSVGKGSERMSADVLKAAVAAHGHWIRSTGLASAVTWPVA
jgi:hypothetical protein